MGKKTAPLLPSSDELLQRFGERLRLARLRRRLAAKQVAERAGMSPMTLRSLERGGSGVTVGAYLAVMQVLGIERDWELLAQADTQGRELQDLRLPAPRTASVVSAAKAAASVSGAAKAAPSVVGAAKAAAPGRSRTRRRAVENARRRVLKQARKPMQPARDWIEQGGFASSEALAQLIQPLASSAKKRR
jgi:transcriptional regulator with XRE-family HTH domain